MECLVWDHACRIIGPYLFLLRRRSLQHLPEYYVAAVCCASTPDGTICQQDGTPPQFANIVRTLLNEQFTCKMDRKKITVHHMAFQITRPNTTRFFFLWRFVKDQVYRTPIRDLVDCTRNKLYCCQQCHTTGAS